MKIYHTQAEIEADIKDGMLIVDTDVKFECSFKISAGIKVAGNIDAWNINALNIDAGNIRFYAVAFAYLKFVCRSIVSKRDGNSKYFCLDGEVEIDPNKPEKKK